MAMFECPPEDGSYIPGQGFEAREMDEYLASAPDVEKCWGNWYFDGASSLLYNTERPEMCFDCRFRKGWQYVFSNLEIGRAHV